jgi:hypothetical protein
VLCGYGPATWATLIDTGPAEARNRKSRRGPLVSGLHVRQTVPRSYRNYRSDQCNGKCKLPSMSGVELTLVGLVLGTLVGASVGAWRIRIIKIRPGSGRQTR